MDKIRKKKRIKCLRLPPKLVWILNQVSKKKITTKKDKTQAKLSPKLGFL